MSNLFAIKKGDNAQVLDRIKRSDGAIPYLRRTIQVVSTSNVMAPNAKGVNQFAGNAAGSGQVNPAQGIQNVGNAYPFYTQGKITFTATSNTITLYWDGTNGSELLVVKRTDGTSFTVPRGTLAIAGLQPATIYGFLPFNCLTNQSNLSFCTGDAGTPRFAFSPTASEQLKAQKNQNQNLASNEAITESFIYYTTAPSGSVAGDGSPGVITPYSERRDAPSEII